MRNALYRSAAIGTFAVFGLSACGSSGGGNGSAGSFRVETDEGTIEASSSATLPADWPSDVPLPAGTQITGASSIDGGSAGQLVSVAALASVSLDEFDAFYVDALSGWEEVLRTDSVVDGMRVLNNSYRLGDRTLAVGGIDRDGQIEVSFSYAYQPGSTTPGSDKPAGSGASGVEGVLGTEGVASALVKALKAERYEISDGAIHVYLGASSSYSAAVACIAGAAVVADTPIVVHDAAGTATPCSS